MGFIEGVRRVVCMLGRIPARGSGSHDPDALWFSREEANTQGKHIFILLTKYSDWLSLVLHYVAGRGFTHTSIALDSDPASYYSFNGRGFVEEKLEKHSRRSIRISCYRVAVDEEAYRSIQDHIQGFQRDRNQLGYSRLGVLCCVLGYPLQRRSRKYFCSQFVAEVLEQSQALALPRTPNLIQPNHFVALLEGNPACVKVM